MSEKQGKLEAIFDGQIARFGFRAVSVGLIGIVTWLAVKSLERQDAQAVALTNLSMSFSVFAAEMRATNLADVTALNNQADRLRDHEARMRFLETRR